MCGYNKINGSLACGGSRGPLVDDLRGRMGFDGWVMTDWWGLKSTEAALNGRSHSSMDMFLYGFMLGEVCSRVGLRREVYELTRVRRGPEYARQ
jgi:hypothetical protein